MNRDGRGRSKLFTPVQYGYSILYTYIMKRKRKIVVIKVGFQKIFIFSTLHNLYVRTRPLHVRVLI